eukprot:gene21994-36575_t
MAVAPWWRRLPAACHAPLREGGEEGRGEETAQLRPPTQRQMSVQQDTVRGRGKEQPSRRQRSPWWH